MYRSAHIVLEMTMTRFGGPMEDIAR